jgi:hypothetical protein
MKLNHGKLDENNKNTLRTFIKQFLPKRGTKRKNSGNEIEYIGNALNLVIKRNFGFNINRQAILEIFEELEYSIFTKFGEWNSEEKKYKPSQMGESIRFGDVYSDNSTGYIYIDIEPKIVRQLMLTVKTLQKIQVNQKEMLPSK